MSASKARPPRISLCGVLVVLVFLTLWREAMTAGPHFFERTVAALTFVTSHITVVVFTNAIIAGQAGPPFLYLLLNFACMYLAAQCLPVGLDGGPARSIDRHDRRILALGAVQTLLFGLTGGLVYALAPQASGTMFVERIMAAVFMAPPCAWRGRVLGVARHIREVKPTLYVLGAPVRVLVVRRGAPGHS
jgi:hypothetical protein